MNATGRAFGIAPVGKSRANCHVKVNDLNAGALLMPNVATDDDDDDSGDDDDEYDVDDD